MALLPYQVTLIAKQDSPYNVLPDTDISIRKASDDTLVQIYADEAGLIPIAQPGAKTNNLGVFYFYAESEGDFDYKAISSGFSENISGNSHNKLTNRNAVGAHDASAISVYGSNVSSILNKNRHSISFVFDDAYETTKTVLKPLFDTYGFKFGMAVPVGSLGNPSRLTLEGVREMASLGYEIINHATSGDVMNSTSKGIGGVMGELATNWSMLNNIGIKTTGFQTPSSVLDDSYLDVVNQFSDYAFTIGNTQAVLPYNTKADGLYRFSIESSTLTECTDVLTELLDSDGGVIFYAHDIVNGDDNYLKIVAILDAATANAIPVLLPRECVSKSVTPLGNKVRAFNEGVTIDNRVSDFSISGGASYAVGGNKDITVTIPSSGTFLLQKVVNLTSKDDIDDLINFSALIRDLTGGIVTTASIAIKTYDALDGGGSVLFTTTEYPIDLNNDVVRYYNETIKGGAKSALFYIRLICSAAGSVLVRQPIIRYGSSINPIKFVDNTPVIVTSVVPSQSITPDVGYQAVTLTDAASNGLFSVTGNSIVFQKNAVVSVVFSPVASGTNIGVGWIGGASAMLIGGGTTAICPIAGGDNFLAGGSSISIRVSRGYAISFRALASGVALQIGTNSRFVISEI